MRVVLGGAILETYNDFENTAAESSNSAASTHASGTVGVTGPGAGGKVGANRTRSTNTSDNRNLTTGRKLSSIQAIGGNYKLFNESQPDQR
jgi:hypothetical protein